MPSNYVPTQFKPNHGNTSIWYVNHSRWLWQIGSNIESLGEFNFCINFSEVFAPSTHQIVTKCHAVRSNLRQRSKVRRHWGQIVWRCHRVTVHQPWTWDCSWFFKTQTNARNTKSSKLNTDYKLSGIRNHCDRFESTSTLLIRYLLTYLSTTNRIFSYTGIWNLFELALKAETAIIKIHCLIHVHCTVEPHYNRLSYNISKVTLYTAMYAVSCDSIHHNEVLLYVENIRYKQLDLCLSV